MGLLDDAIREHLELKRRHGADPGEVARQEHEALGPARREREPAPAAAPEDDEPVLEELGEPPAWDEEPEPEPLEPVLEPEDDEPFAPAARGLDEAPEPAPDPEPEPDPEPRSRLVSIDDIDQPTVEHPAARPQPERDEDGDVLEGTPEFLEETPEHDRLWFEQRPPRDFDFDG